MKLLRTPSVLVRHSLFALLAAIVLLPIGASAAGRGSRTWLDADGQALPFATVDEVVDFLATAEVVGSKDLSTGITKPKKLTLERDGVRAHAVFHTINRREQKPKRLFNGEFVMHLLDSYRGQVAAFELSRLLGIDSVPPTVVRKAGGRLGSVQLWIENAITEQKRRDRSLEPPDQTVWNQGKADQWVFDNLINNLDRNTGNTLIDGAWNLWMIDHTRSFGPDRQLPYPERIKSLSREFWARLNQLDPVEVEERLRPYLGKSEIRALLVRREMLIDALESRIARLGEARIVYEPGKPWSAIGWIEATDGSSSSSR